MNWRAGQQSGTTTDIANALFSIPLAAECRPQFCFQLQEHPVHLELAAPGWKHSPTICHELIQIVLEKGKAPEHLQYFDDIVWGNKAKKAFEKGEKIIQILLKAHFAIKQSKFKGSAQEIQLLEVKWQDGCHQIPMDEVNKQAAVSPQTPHQPARSKHRFS